MSNTHKPISAKRYSTASAANIRTQFDLDYQEEAIKASNGGDIVESPVIDLLSLAVQLQTTPIKASKIVATKFIPGGIQSGLVVLVSDDEQEWFPGVTDQGKPAITDERGDYVSLVVLPTNRFIKAQVQLSQPMSYTPKASLQVAVLG